MSKKHGAFYGTRPLVAGKRAGSFVFSQGYGLRIGSRDTYHDFSF